MQDSNLILGDCMEKLRDIETRSIDALVTDPPAGIGFMNKEWDDHKGGRNAWVKWFAEVMAECLRTMKPGAHGLVWALPRTSHWTGWALERAGFEIRDCVYHFFGSGFPKSHDISKSIDRECGAKREVVGKRTDGRYGSKFQDGNNQFVTHNKNKKEVDSKIGLITEPSTEDAKQWEGWGTALKPAVEQYWLIRKPLDQETIALNVRKWGVGGINVDGCRIGTEEKLNQGSSNLGFNGVKQPKVSKQNSIGRFPSHLILDETAAEMLDKQTGETSKGGKPINVDPSKSMFGIGQNSTFYKDTGGASRFFYVAKPSKREREIGLQGEPQKVNDGRDTPIDNAFQRGETERLNIHPTVKPIALMRYLCRLITPPEGLILDPFMGSGTTGCAASLEGFCFTGIERIEDYYKIAEKRIQSCR